MDTEIEWLESLIASYEDYDRFQRHADGGWSEWSDHATRTRSILVNKQAVLFAIKEGL